MMQSLLRIGQVAQLLDVSANTARNLLKNGKVPFVNLSPKGHRYKRADIEKFIERQTQIHLDGALCQSQNVAIFGGYASRSTGKKLDALLG